MLKKQNKNKQTKEKILETFIPPPNKKGRRTEKESHNGYGGDWSDNYGLQSFLYIFQ